MNYNPLLTVFLVGFLIHQSVKGDVEHKYKPANTSLIVLGRSGSGISSTVKQLLGPSKHIIRPNSTDNAVIQVYEVPLASKGFFKIVDVEGLVDGKLVNQDLRVLSTLKTYLNDSIEGLSSPPNFFLVISKFDDSRIHGIKSIFTLMFRRVQMLQKEVYGNTTLNTALLLTRLMTDTKAVQRKPQTKIEQFRSAIQEFTSFPANSTEIIVGENLPEEYNLKVENGQTRLPNKEFYPQNVFDSLLKIAASLNDTEGEAALREFMDKRNLPEEIEVKPYQLTKSNESTTDDSFYMKLHQADSEITKTNLSEALSQAFDSLNDTIRAHGISSLLQLQRHFQSSGLTSFNDLPNNTLDKVRFFQNVPPHQFQLTLLSAAFNLTPPEFVEHPVVGFGFDVTMDEILMTSPFVTDILKPSSIGYIVPNFISCSPINPPNQVDIAFYNDTLSQYVQTRMELFHFERNETLDYLEGIKLKTGFTLKPLQYETLLSLSTVREFRSMECKLTEDALELNDEFINTINELSSCDRSVMDSMTEWKAFFGKYGTHVVSLAYGGGRIEGSFRSKSLKETFESHEKVFEALENIVNFRNMSYEERPSYRFFGTPRNSPSPEEIYTLEEKQREESLAMWKNSIKYDPVMLDYELSLSPISKFATLVNSTAGGEVEKCTLLLLSGKLFYKRKIKPTRTRLNKTDSMVPTKPPVLNLNSSSLYTTSQTNFIELSSSTYPPSTQSTVSSTSEYNPWSHYALKTEKNNPNNAEQSTTTTAPYISYENTESSKILEEDSQKVEQLPLPKICEYERRRYSNNKWRNLDDDSMNIVGQGYNLLTGVILHKSPYTLGREATIPVKRLIHDQSCKLLRYAKKKIGSNSIFDMLKYSCNPDNSPVCPYHTSLPWRENVQITKLNEPHLKDNKMSFYTEKEYILNRIVSTSGSNFEMNEVPKGFQAKIPPWVYIESSQDRQPQEGKEWRFSTLMIKEGTLLSKEFLDYLKSLTPMNKNCSVKCAWKEFFETYGTHYIKSAFVGVPDKTYTRDYFLSLSHEEQQCNLVVLKPSIGLERIGLLLADWPSLKVEVDEAYYQLLRNNLEC